MRLNMLVLAGLILLFPVEASAQAYLRIECQPIASQPAPKFDDNEHRLWYRRFWNGDCGGLGFCSPGTPNWNSTVAQIIQRAPTADRAAITAKACRLGRLVGFEWARNNSIRKIDTSEISKFYSELNSATDVETSLARVEQQAQTDLGR